MRAGIVIIGLLLGSCGAVLDVVAPAPVSAPPAPDPEPDYRQLISEHIAELFPESAGLRNVGVSPLRRAQFLDGPAWRVCFKADVRNMNGEYLAAQTYVIAMRKNRITDRRRATAEDGCQTETFEGMAF